jgi:hypothetical protein
MGQSQANEDDAPWSKPQAGDIRLPNPPGRSPTNPAPEVTTRRIIAANKPAAAPPSKVAPMAPGASAITQAAQGLQILKDKGLVGTRKMSR